MSDVHAQTTRFVRDTMLPQKEPPLSEQGGIKWVRENLFSSKLNVILTILGLAITAWIVISLAPWLWNSVWNAGNLNECREVLAANSSGLETSGACWAVVRDRWLQLLMGTYPRSEYWRSILTLILFFVALAPILFPERMPRFLLVVSAAFPFVMPWLLWGGSFWVPILYAAGFVLGYLAFRFGAALHSALVGIIAAIVVALTWWIFLLPVVNDALHTMVAQPRLEEARVEAAAEAETLRERLDAITAEQEGLSEQIDAMLEVKTPLIAEILAERFRRNISEDLPSVIGHLETAVDADWQGALAELRDVRDIMTPYSPDQAAAELGTPLNELRTAARAISPLGETPEDGTTIPDEARTRLQELLTLAREAEGVAGAGAISDADLDEKVSSFNQILVDLTELREARASLGAEFVDLDERRRTAENLVRNIDRRDENQAALPGLIEEAEAARAALPEITSGIMTIPEETEALDPNITDDQLSQLREVIDLEEEVETTALSIDNVYEEVGRIGLRPMATDKFGGFQLSLIIGITSILMSLPLGVLLALGRQSPLLIINKVSVVFIEVIRGVPLIVWLMVANFLLNFFLPPGTEFDTLLRVIIMVTIFSAAYIAEVVRGGLAALPKGQYEAADALGLDYWKSMRLIVLPQALKISIPGIVNTFIGLLKDTTLVVFIGLSDPLNTVTKIRADTDWNGIYWELYIFVAVLFFFVCYGMSRYSQFLERKLQREHR